MSRDEARAAYGPYFDYTARADALETNRDSSARLCAKKVLAGEMHGARYWAEQYAAEQAELARITARFRAADKAGDAAWLIGLHHDHGPAAGKLAREVTDGPEPA